MRVSSRSRRGYTLDVGASVGRRPDGRRPSRRSVDRRGTDLPLGFVGSGRRSRMLHGADPSSGCGPGGEHSRGVEQFRFEKRQATISVNDTSLGDQSSRANGRRRFTLSFKSRLKLVGFEGGEQGRADSVIQHRGLKGASTLPVGLVKSSVAAKATSILPLSGCKWVGSRPSVAAARGNGARPYPASQNGPDRFLIKSPWSVICATLKRRRAPQFPLVLDAQEPPSDPTRRDLVTSIKALPLLMPFSPKCRRGRRWPGHVGQRSAALRVAPDGQLCQPGAHYQLKVGRRGEAG